MENKTKRAFIIVDVQNDGIQEGPLTVPKGSGVVPVINSIRKKNKFDLIVLTQDWHPSNHSSFAINNNAELFSVKELETGPQIMWPVHCVQNTEGSQFVSDLIREESDIIIQKGTNPKVDSYSAFWNNNKSEKTDLEDILNQNNITDVYVCGLAYDYCVSFTAVGSVECGFKTFFIEDATEGLEEETILKAKEKMEKIGVIFVKSIDLDF
ncbi:pyrazinamidase/nicotinamidase [Anaeramoeba ignava]|uniref:nicotinamidase n=1 Tax=Anaeramoeba ignava TaxID=1746090 RepID=A0A9Q0LPL3_ANAIG|nr:pyrazinamidase/nicotinamidase [Anaeramoeba ignava]